MVKVRGALDLKLMRVQPWDSRLGASCRDRTVALGLFVHSLDGRGKRYVAEFPAAYHRYAVEQSDETRSLTLGLADYALPAASVDLFSVASREPYLKESQLTFTSKTWEVTTHAEQTGVRFASVRPASAPSN